MKINVFGVETPCFGLGEETVAPRFREGRTDLPEGKGILNLG